MKCHLCKEKVTIYDDAIKPKNNSYHAVCYEIMKLLFNELKTQIKH